MRGRLVWSVAALIGVGALGAAWHYRLLPVPSLVPAHHGPVAAMEAFKSESAASGGSDPYFFRTVLLSDSAQYGGLERAAGKVVSLNPADPQVAPRIFDTAHGTLTEVERVAADLPDATIEQVLEIAAFAGDYAAALAVVRQGETRQERWGYVNAHGKWVVGPRYAGAELPVNQWARVRTLPEPAADRQIVNLETGGVVPLPEGQRLCGDNLRPLGHDAQICLAPEAPGEVATEGAPWLLRAGTSKVVPLPARPWPEQWGDSPLILLTDGRYVERESGKVVEPPEPTGRTQELLPAVGALYAKGTTTLSVWDAARNSIVARRLTAAEPLTRELFVACEQGEAKKLVVRYGNRLPQPLDPGSDLRCGLMDREGKWRIKAEYQQFYRFDDGAVVFRKESEWCELLDKANEPACGAQVPRAMISGGVWLDAEGGDDPARRSGRFGYRDAEGSVQIPFQFEAAGAFLGQVAAVQRLGTPGLIDTSGRWLTPAPAGDILALNPSRANFGAPCTGCSAPAWGLINRKGEWVLPPVFDEAFAGEKPEQYWVRKGEQLYLVSETGQVLEESGKPAPELLAKTSGGLPEVSNDLVAAAINGKWGLADGNRRWLVRPQHEAVAVLSAERALVKSGGLWGMVDGGGKWVFQPRFKGLEAVNERFAIATAAGADQDERVLIDVDGKVLATDPLPRTMTSSGGGMQPAASFDAAGMALAQVESTVQGQAGEWGWLDRNGEWIIRPRFKEALAFNGAYALAKATPPRPEAKLPLVLLPYAVEGSWTWPSARLAVVAMRPAQGSGGGQPQRFGLMDENGNWRLPNKEYWQPAR